MIIRRAKLNELEELRDFYNTNWGARHALINVKAYIDFYFVDGEYLNFVIARETESSEIASACGYTISNSTDSPDIWTALWLTKKGVRTKVATLNNNRTFKTMVHPYCHNAIHNNNLSETSVQPPLLFGV